LYLSRQGVVASDGAGAEPPVPALTMANPLGEPARATLRLPRGGRATVSLFDITGRRVWTMRETEVPAGASTISLGPGVPLSGTYFWTLRLDGRILARGKLTMIR
jgi:hypothetical protein